jgi:hypothetical protein
VAKLVPMLGAVFAHAAPPDASGKKRQPKPKTTRKGHTVTKGEMSMAQPGQQHGELATAAEPKPVSDRTQMRDHAKRQMRRATEDWVSGHVTTSEHKAVHDRAKHVLAGKHPSHYSGKSGERKMKMR